MLNSLSYLTRPKDGGPWCGRELNAFESGWEMGGRLAAATLLLHKFGPLDKAKQKRFWAWPLLRIDELIVAISDAPSWEGLGLAADKAIDSLVVPSFEKALLGVARRNAKSWLDPSWNANLDP